MHAQEFVDELEKEMQELFGSLGEREALESESEGNVEIVTLLRLALKSEVEAAEIAGAWIPTTPELDAKSVFARQAADEMKHYELICKRLRELDAEPGPLQAAHSPLYQYLSTLRTTVERVAGGPFAREAVAEVRNAQFIDFCLASDDQDTARLYQEIIQPEEILHNRAGRDLLLRYATTPELQESAARAVRTSLAIADELQTLARKSTGVAGVPVS